MTGTECMFCDLHRSANPPEGGWVLRNDLVSASILPGCEYPGWFVLQVNRHAEGYREFTAAEAAAVGTACWSLACAVQDVTGAHRTYQYAIGENNPHFHMLIGPPPHEATERGKRLLAGIITREAPFLDVEKAHEVARRTAAALARPSGTPGGAA
jgi:diadenosine tetraphosphate (Ap4A) HIT family hydrolase